MAPSYPHLLPNWKEYGLEIQGGYIHRQISSWILPARGVLGLLLFYGEIQWCPITTGHSETIYETHSFDRLQSKVMHREVY